jgi:hypothetical protein
MASPEPPVTSKPTHGDAFRAAIDAHLRAHEEARLNWLKRGLIWTTVEALVLVVTFPLAGPVWLYLLAVCGIVAASIWMDLPSGIHRGHAVQVITDTAQPGDVGELLKLTRHYSEEVRDAAREALIHVLPRVKAEDGERIDQPAADALFALFAGGVDVWLTEALLDAQPSIGDERTLRLVRRIANDPEGEYPDLPPPTRERMRAAALRCLPGLEQRAARLRLRGTLLRAAAPRAEGELLRPLAHAGPVTDPEALLRAAPLADHDD